MVLSAQGFGEKALSRCCVAFSREQEVDRRTAGVHGPVQAHPLAFNADISFVHPPTVVGWFESGAQTSFHLRGIALYPTRVSTGRQGMVTPAQRQMVT